ncbi:uncharacterized protein LOC125557539 [Nematostella vectensis]|uniref:uncharacterized protein LOC125557539 n=1 Tax=Nematostella vectensis TaxID=45351 RepID=UPI002076F5E2|nr:uncharacterized protein LOC125557539 [Nematostella vectensis]
MIKTTSWSSPGEVFSTDACLVGCGGVCDNEYFHASFPDVIVAKSLDINCLELLTIVVALKLWGQRWTGLRLTVRCDNQVAVTVLNSDSSALASLQKDLRQTLQAAYSTGTYSNLKTQFKAFFLFCLYFDLTPLPADIDTVCLYVQFLSRSIAPPSIRNYLSGVKLLHLFAGYDYAFTKDFSLSLALRGVSRRIPHVPQRAPPVTPSLLLLVARTVDFQHDANSSTLYCAFLFAFFLMARIANIVPRSIKAFNPTRDLTRGGVLCNEHGLIVTFKHTKTIQFGQRRLHIPLLRIPGSLLCPVAAYNNMIRLVPSSARKPLFLLLGRSGPFALTKSRFVTEFRLALCSVGVAHADSYRGHSFRRGCASWSFNHGVPGELIQLYGDWASDSYKLYLEFSNQSKLALASQLRASIQASS